MKQALAIVFVALMLAGCSYGRVRERVAYWEQETARHLNEDASLAEAEAFFAQRGLKLTCCISSPPQIRNSHYAAERKAGRVLWTEYDVVVLVDISDARSVQATRVITLGAGL